MEAGKGDVQTICEARLASEWPALRHSLTAAQLAWDDSLGVPALAGARPSPAAATLELPLPHPQPIHRPQPSTLPIAWRDRLRQRAARLSSPASLSQLYCRPLLLKRQS